jgi:hypothetical protein
MPKQFYEIDHSAFLIKVLVSTSFTSISEKLKIRAKTSFKGQSFFAYGLYYKNVTKVNDASRVINE